VTNVDKILRPQNSSQLDLLQNSATQVTNSKLAQQCKLDHSNVLPAHEMTRSPFSGFSPIVIPIENFNWDATDRLWVYKFENLHAAMY